MPPPHMLEGDFRKEERRIASEFDVLFGEDNLIHDLWLYDIAIEARKTKDGWISFDDLQVRTKTLGDDEAVFSKSLRAYSRTVEVHEDGKSIKPKFLPEIESMADRMVYVEFIPSRLSADKFSTYFAQAGSVERTIKPPRGSKHDYAFIVYKSPSAITKAKESLHKFAPFNKETWKVAAEKESAIIGSSEDDAFRDVRILGRREWEKLMREYSRFVSAQWEEVKSKQNHGSAMTEQFQPGVLVRFWGVHKDTDARILKRFFGRIAQVCYVDYQTGGSGVLRFESAYESQVAISYFTRELVQQIDGKDVSGKLMGVTSSLSIEIGPGSDAENVVRLQLICGAEEVSYWESLTKKLAKKETKPKEPEAAFIPSRHAKRTQNVPTRVQTKRERTEDENADGNEGMQAKKHIRFDFEND
ncbi:hypothetical protein BJ742DRAFT_770507 [Cladochytrium replicatum]|nr:hypothetical protein BJ742DRAFT_770507 [Cladochytrium replicatum]